MINNKDSIPRIIDELRDRPKANGLLDVLISLVADSLADRLERSYCELKKERDELKAKLESTGGKIDFNVAQETVNHLRDRLASAELCICEIMNELSKAVAGDSIRNVNKAKKIIRAYSEKKGCAK